jgi:lipopolysaccharide biosynthesis glycosyltransferase
VFSTNEYFVPYLGVAIYSLIRNRSDNYNYDIVILGHGLAESSQKKLISLAADISNVRIRYFDMRTIFQSLPPNTFHVEGYVPVETYDKCFVTQVLTGYERCLYLDSDIVVVDDVQKLHDIDMEGNAIGASVNIANVNAAYAKKVIKGRQFDDYLQNELGVVDRNRYFQAGVLLLDMKAMEKMNLTEKAMQALREVRQPVFFDQCLFNKIFYGNVKFFSTAWNHVWYMQNYSYLKSSIPTEVFYDYAHSRVSPSIIHFASKDKPHTKYGWELGDIFWKYAYESPFISDILNDLDAADNEVARTRRSIGGKNWYRATPRILIHIHLFYVEQTGLMVEMLRNVTGCDYTLYVTMNERNPKAEKKFLEVCKDANFLVVPNVGYDVYPFLHVLQQVRLAAFDFVLKMHTKNERKPGQDTVYGIPIPGYRWRDELLEAIVGSKGTFSRNLALLTEDKRVGCVGAKRFIFTTTENREEITYRLPQWREKCGVISGEHYIGGSMFLARSYPFERLKTLRLRPEDFKSTQMGTKDYKNTAHIIERLFGIVIENEGFAIHGV